MRLDWVIMEFDWKQVLGLSHGDVLGLDVGSSSVRMVQIQKNGGSYVVTAANITEIKGDDDDEVNRAANIVNAIRLCVESSGVRTRRAVCSVSGPEVAVRHFGFPPLEQGQLEGAIRLEASQVCPFNVDDGVLDYQVVPDGDNAMRGVFVAATHNVINRKIRMVEQATLDCVMMDVDGLALVNCFNEHKQQTLHELTTTAILDVGASGTTLAIMGDNKLPFIRNMPYAGREMISQIADENNVTVDAVHDDLFGGKRRSVPVPNLRVSLAKACQKLVTDIVETLRYHTAQEKYSLVEQILVCGGFALAEGFVDTLGKGLPVKTVLWNPLEAMQCNLAQPFADIVRSKGTAMAVATGLAMRSI
jgi:type IV pilus assembly protein PilM